MLFLSACEVFHLFFRWYFGHRHFFYIELLNLRSTEIVINGRTWIGMSGSQFQSLWTKLRNADNCLKIWTVWSDEKLKQKVYVEWTFMKTEQAAILLEYSMRIWNDSRVLIVFIISGTIKQCQRCDNVMLVHDDMIAKIL